MAADQAARWQLVSVTCTSARYKNAVASSSVMRGTKPDPQDFNSRVFVKDGVRTHKMLKAELDE